LSKDVGETGDVVVVGVGTDDEEDVSRDIDTNPV